MCDQDIIETLKHQIGNLTDRLEIIELEGKYGPNYDAKNGEQWAALFTDDGVYQGRHLQGGTETNYIQGKENLERFCNSGPNSGIHYLSIPQISINGDLASSKIPFQFQGFRVDFYGNAIHTEVNGYYDVLYRRTNQGWKIQNRITVNFNSSNTTTHGYDGSDFQFDSENPKIDENTPYRDIR